MLSQRVALAGVWSMALRIFVRTLTVIRTLVLARILAPADFGLFGVAMLVNTLLTYFTEVDVRTALIQKKSNIDAYLNTAWTMQILRSLVLAGVIVALAPVAGIFFDAPDAVLVVRVMAIAVFIRGFVNIGTVYFHRDLEFHRRFVVQLSEVVAQVAVSIALALVLRNVWAFVLGSISGASVWVIASYLMHPYRPRPSMDWAKAKEIFDFSKWILVSNMLRFVNLRSMAMVTGRMLGTVALGVFQVASNFTDAISQEMPNVIWSVIFPAFSRVQDDLRRLRRGFFAAMDIIASVSVPAVIGVVVLADPIVRTVLGEQWQEVARILPPLGIGACLLVIQMPGGALFWATGRPWLGPRLQATRTVVLLALAVPLINSHGISGAGYASMAGAMSTIPLFLWFTKGILETSPLRHVAALLPAAVLTAIVASVALAGERLFGSMGAVELLATFALAGLAYLAACWLLWRFFKVGPGRALVMLRSGLRPAQGSPA